MVTKNLKKRVKRPKEWSRSRADESDTGEDHFTDFQGVLERAIAKEKERDPKPFFTRQKEQFTSLVSLENEFKLALIRHSSGLGVFRDFITYICDTRKNILDARPYFRERQEVFAEKISEAFRTRSPRALFRFRFNYRFVQFVLQARDWAKGSKIRKLASQISEVRQSLLVMNMPLAISRSRLFWRKTQRSHLSFMDLVQIAAEGFLSGIDKFTPPYTHMFRGVAVGRISGSQISSYSETLVHFFPPDKRKIYRANKAVGRSGGGPHDYAKIMAGVNEGLPAQLQTTEAEISGLMAAASTVSADSIPVSSDEEDRVSVNRFAAPSDCQPDVRVEQGEALADMLRGVAALDNQHRKAILLRGGAIGSREACLSLGIDPLLCGHEE